MSSLRLLTIAAMVSTPVIARAADKLQCLDAHTSAQRDRRLGQLRAAKEQLIRCSDAGCPAPVVEDCTRWLGEVEAEQPTIVLAAKDAAGNDLTQVRVQLDGVLLLEQLDGRPVDVDPGDRVFRFESPDGIVVEKQVLVRAGEKARLVEAALIPKAREDEAPAIVNAAPLPPPRTTSIPTTAWVLWAGAVVAGGTSAYFGIRGRMQESELDRTCRGYCSSDDVSSVRLKYIAADVSLIVALVSGGVGTLMALLFPTDDE